MAVFFGAISGSGVTGGGIVFIEGDARPGFSPGAMTYGGDVSFGPSASLQMEIGGTVAGTQYDRLVVAGDLTLGGTLDVTLINGFVPSAGATFTVWTAGSRNGAFTSIVLSPLPAGLFWRTEQVNITGVLSVSTTPSTYAAWAAAYTLTTPPEGDQAMDGIPNALECAFGLNPRLANAGSVGLPRLRKNAGQHILDFEMVVLPPADLQIEIQSDPNLTAWPVLAARTGSALWTGAIPPTLGPNVGGHQTVSLTRSNGGEPRVFYRLAARVVP